jgi:hypothetical protein
LTLKNDLFIGKHQLSFEPYLNGEVLVEKMIEIESRQVSIYGTEGPTNELIMTCVAKFGKVETVSWEKRHSDGLYFGSVTFRDRESVQKSLEAGSCMIDNLHIVKIRSYMS